MPNPNEIIKGSARRLWLIHAARAIIATTTPGGRFLIMRGGFVNFQIASKVPFREEAGWFFDGNELRFIWEYLVAYAVAREGQLHPRFEEIYQQGLHHDRERPPEESEPDDYIVTENITDGMLKRRVH